MKKVVSAVVIVLSVILTSCWYNHKWEEMHPNGQLAGPPAPCDTAGTISYSVTVQPIIQAKCATAGCHVLHAQTNFNVFSNVVTDAQRTDGSDIMTRMNLPTSDPLYMPQSSTMTSCDVAKIRVWINQGCQNN
ncbi:MAG: hypothetical protein ACXVC6_09885 [Bacteroidia bacterium]